APGLRSPSRSPRRWPAETRAGGAGGGARRRQRRDTRSRRPPTTQNGARTTIPHRRIHRYRMSEPVVIRSVGGRADFRRFIDYAYERNANDPHWIPPLRLSEHERLKPTKNPF